MTKGILKITLGSAFLTIVAAYICDYTKHEAYSFCGNLCEDKCSDNLNCNVLDIAFSILGFDSPLCKKGCYCREDYIRNEAGACVLNTAKACKVNKCDGIKNAVWKRCSYNKQPACKSERAYTPDPMWKTRCVCPSGLYMSNIFFAPKACVPRSSFVCRVQGMFSENDFYLPAPKCASKNSTSGK